MTYDSPPAVPPPLPPSTSPPNSLGRYKQTDSGRHDLLRAAPDLLRIHSNRLGGPAGSRLAFQKAIAPSRATSNLPLPLTHQVGWLYPLLPWGREGGARLPGQEAFVISSPSSDMSIWTGLSSSRAGNRQEVGDHPAVCGRGKLPRGNLGNIDVAAGNTAIETPEWNCGLAVIHVPALWRKLVYLNIVHLSDPGCPRIFENPFKTFLRPI